jgi:hypothetical protein
MPEYFAVYNDRLNFAAESSEHGKELYCFFTK